MARLAATIATPVSVRVATVVRANDGRKRLTGVVSERRPSSSSMSTAALVSALVCEAMRNTALGVMRCFVSRSLQPTARSYTTWSSRNTSATAPPISSCTTAASSIESMRASRSTAKPWRNGMTVRGAGCARPGVPTTIPASAQAHHRKARDAMDMAGRVRVWCAAANVRLILPDCRRLREATSCY